MCKLHVYRDSYMYCVFNRAATKERRTEKSKPVKDAISVNADVLLVEVRLQFFLQVWAVKGSSPRVILILKEGYNLLFKIKHLTKKPLTRRPKCNSHWNTNLKETLHSLLQKQAMDNIKFSHVWLSSAICSLLQAQPKLYLGPQYL